MLVQCFVKANYNILPNGNDCCQIAIDNLCMNYMQRLMKYNKFRREELGLSLNQFCFEAEIETSTLSRYENDKRKLSFDVLVKIAKFYNQTPAEFLADFEKYDKANY